MKIRDASVLMTSARTFQTQYKKEEKVRVWADPENPGLSEDRVTISQQAGRCLAARTILPGDCLSTEAQASLSVTLEALLAEVLSGRKVEMLDISRSEKGRKSAAGHNGAGDGAQDTSAERVGWGVRYNSHESYGENENVAFFAVGTIQTADGKHVDFAMRLDMHREYVVHHGLDFRAGDAVLMDPLVVNFDGNATQLGNTTFAFDLDANGTEEQLPTLGPGSGFLAIDLNHDCMVINGTELFGPRTGQGFAELSEYDADGNHWIDEADPAYDQLVLWTMDDEGNGVLSTLRDRGIGAIYLGNLTSRFDVKGADNGLKGRVSHTSIYVREDGSPGTVQEVDLAVQGASDG